MIYSIEAIDNFFFRNASPFDAGTNFHATSLFPPLPSVYAGAIITTTGISARQLKINFNGLMVNGDIMFPQPLDMEVTEQKQAADDISDEKYKLDVLHLKPKSLSSAVLPYSLQLTRRLSGEKTKNPAGGGYIKREALNQYIQAGDESLYSYALSDFIEREKHTGIQMDPATGRTEEGKWYTTERVKPITNDQLHCQLAVEIEGTDVNRQTIIKLGGESKTAVVNPLTKQFSIDVPASNCKYFKLYLATPAIFKNGWLPKWINEETWDGVFTHRNRRIKVKLLNAAVGRAVAAGGFGVKQGKPKELQLAAPAGTVYFFQILEGSFFDAVKLFHQKCISDYRENLGFANKKRNRLRYCDRGFGYSLVAKVSSEQLKEVE
ncbi:type III-B CRISPR module-associated Cmr3 family protein [Gracilibacillus timonensis]|uniref:type III-B CRISPR module-associated Cmr3 family protein n=1 Tax=Gracilibacillus timonensis TaxID=1816696 RepID=UPI0008270E23|nr:type III-B CRISPR module-associated Cmr3 family protein [Gracilibacillus timonensis]